MTDDATSLKVVAKTGNTQLFRMAPRFPETAVIDYGVHRTEFGDVLVAMTSEGICRLDFVDALADAAPTFLHRLWPAAQLQENPVRTAAVVSTLFAASEQSVNLHIAGSDFQFAVWQTLLGIPSGQCISYGQLAAACGHPGAARAVGSAVAANPVALLIPCHRVVCQDGRPGEYRWGAARKQALLAAEARA